MNASKFAFFGTPPLCIEILDALEGAGHVPSLVVTMPDRAKGRGMQLAQTPVATWAQERNIETLKPEKLDAAFIDDIKTRALTTAIVVAYGKIIPQSLLDSFPRGMFNIHYSLLPRWRGATPVESAILAGDAETGVAIQKMVFALDAGPVAMVEQTLIGPDENAHELRARLNTMAKHLLVELLPHILDGTVALREQDSSLATRARMTTKEDGLLNLNDDGLLNYRKYRAYHGWPGTYAFFERDGEPFRVIISKAHMANSHFVIDTVKPAGKNEMPYTEFQRSGAKPISG